MDGGVGNFTYFSEASPSLIDYILVYVLLWCLCVDFEVMAVVGSDHLPVGLLLNGIVLRN